MSIIILVMPVERRTHDRSFLLFFRHFVSCFMKNVNNNPRNDNGAAQPRSFVPLRSTTPAHGLVSAGLLNFIRPFRQPKRGCSIAETFHFLHFLLDESYVRVRVFQHTYEYIYIYTIKKAVSEILDYLAE